jgi:hypothetical protein
LMLLFFADVSLLDIIHSVSGPFSIALHADAECCLRDLLFSEVFGLAPARQHYTSP